MYTNTQYNTLLVFHSGLGVLFFIFRPLAVVYGLLILVIGVFWIFRNQNKNEEALLVAAYLMGAEVFLRMTKGTLNHEFVKYSIMLILLLGMYLKGFSKNAVPYLVFFILLLPGIVIGMLTINQEERFRQILMFNLSGPFCLIIASIYCYNRKITFKKIMDVLLFAGLPIIGCATYLVLYTPDLKEVLVNTGSNFDTSGGFGPNQVATILGFGLFAFFARALFSSPTKWQLLINLLIVCFFSYRALLTFSRGGLLTGLFMVILLLGIVFFKGNSNAKMKIVLSIGTLISVFIIIWLYTVFLTGGLIEKRYANQDAQGREKASMLSGREEIALTEIDLFLESPYLGGGVGSGTVYRRQLFDASIASHNEVTRMIGEHGMFGIMGLLLLIATPLFLFIDNRNHFFLLSFLAFWFLTLNHAAMRTAAPSFVYALCLLKIQMDENTVIYRKQIIETWNKRFNN